MRRKGITLRRGSWLLVGIAILVGICLIWRLQHRHEPTLKIVFLDVGQGDCAVIESPSGKTMLIDTGGLRGEGRDDEGRRTVEPFLRGEGINHLDMILLTHPHADHIGGAATLIDDFPVDSLIDNGAEDTSEENRKVLTEAHVRGLRYFPAKRDERLDFGDGVTGTIVAPTPIEITGPINDASVVVRLQYGRTSFLFTGDAEAAEEETMVSDRENLKCDVLKVGHHGSRTSSTPMFLAAANPRVAIISVGARNMYGHPSPEVTDRLSSDGIRTFRTDRNGAVTCVSDSISVSCSAQIPDR